LFLNAKKLKEKKILAVGWITTAQVVVVVLETDLDDFVNRYIEILQKISMHLSSKI